MQSKFVPLLPIIAAGWHANSLYVANGHEHEFDGRNKEAKVLERLQQGLAYPDRGIVTALQVSLGNWKIDLVCTCGDEKVAVEGKYKTLNDGAVPDNRKEAFFDLYKLEHCVASREYTKGLFLWLTNQPRYLKIATGDSADFSTHNGRVYQPETPLNAHRARRQIPMPFTLHGQYLFDWIEIIVGAGWYMLMLEVK